MVVEETIRSYYEYVDSEAYEELFSLFADDIVYERPGSEPLEGIDEFQEFYLEHRPIGESSHSIDGIYVDEDTAVVRGTFEGTLDGDPVSFGFADVHQFDQEGAIARRWTYTDLGTV
jgi:ketosteroid isomerase-like protein